MRAAIDQYKRYPLEVRESSLCWRARTRLPQAQIWAVSDSPEAFAGLLQSGSAANFGKVFGQLDGLTFTADMSKGLNLVATGECRTEQDAKTLGDAMRGLVSRAR